MFVGPTTTIQKTASRPVRRYFVTSISSSYQCYLQKKHFQHKTWVSV